MLVYNMLFHTLISILIEEIEKKLIYLWKICLEFIKITDGNNEI